MSGTNRPRLRLLDVVSFDGAPVAGERVHALLATLAFHHPARAVGEESLVAEIWGDALPANPGKALHVLVSRARGATAPEVIERVGNGYRLALADDDVDVFCQRSALAATTGTNGTTPDGLARLRTAYDVDIASGPPGVLGDLRGRAAATARAIGRRLGVVLAESGAYAEALPLLEGEERDDHDEREVAALLRSVAAVRGAGAALAHYEKYRERLADELGVDPGPALRTLHRDLLARDRPVRSGLRYDATALLGRDRDVAAVTASLGSSRVVTVLGPGGLGKTRLATVVGRTAEQPVVHFVELVGVGSPEDVVGEVGSEIGVRDSFAGRRVLTPEQRADVRARLAQQLAQAPTLLVLDNCEHVIEAVADLVAFLVATVADLRVLTTSRAPLGIAAERIYSLAQLGTADAVELFVERATSARPGVALPEGEIEQIVTRLDGLPLAIELAAAKVRAMSVSDVARRLDNRFALLTDGDRSAPDRHQTLVAVIDWSWNLLSDDERRALRRLSLFHDGFTLTGAEAVLGDGALAAVEELVAQSLLSVVDTSDGVRYRMLETVREFGRMQLGDAGDEADARLAHRRWATTYADEHASRLYAPAQVAAVDALRAEEANLSDALRQALLDEDREPVVQLTVALSGLWAIRGEHGRAMSLVSALSEVITGWRPPDRLLDRARLALALTLLSATLVETPEKERIHGALRALGTDAAAPPLRALVTVILAMAEPDGFRDGIGILVDDPDPQVRAIGLQALTHERENAGDPEAAIAASGQALALVDDQHGPWAAAIIHAQAAGLCAQVGDARSAADHARAAIPTMARLGAHDDQYQLEAMLAVAALEEGRLGEVEQVIERIDAAEHVGRRDSAGALSSLRAMVAITRGDTAAGLRLLRDSVQVMRSVGLPGMPREMEMVAPWVMYAESIALTAHAQYGDGADGADLFDALRARAEAVLAPDRPFIDLPVAGVVLFGLGTWGLLRDALPAEDAVRLLVLAERFAYHRFMPTMRWELAVASAERAAPGVLPAIEEEYGERRGPALRDEARGVLARLFGHTFRE